MTREPGRRHDVFLSHSSSDKSAVEAVAQRLRAEGVEVFLDKWHLIPGDAWQEALEEALEESATCAVFLGPSGISPWQNKEMRVALEKAAKDRSARVILVLLPGSSEPEEGELSFLRLLTWVDWRAGLEDEDGLRRLIAGIRRVAPEDVRLAKRISSRSAWNVPHRRNQYFTGRDEILERLHAALNAEGSAALGQAISGLGGIGKTQTAVEYCYRYRDDYEAVLWARAETEAELVAGLVEIARVLDLPEKDAQEQEQAVQAVVRWLEEKDSWLLVFDNADTPAMLAPYLPKSPKGHLLLTSRAPNFDVLEVAPLRLELLSAKEAEWFLLERVRRSDPADRERQAARDLAEVVGSLPLALEHAGAYISLHATSFVAYLKSYRSRRLKLLAEGPLRDYREPVTTTWSLNFDQVAAKSEAAAEVLRVCAFMAPDRIPLEIFVQGAAELGPELSEALEGAAEDPSRLDQLLHPLLQYSLLERDPEAGTISIHRVVQEAVRQSLEQAQERTAAEGVVGALVRSYPGPEVDSWPLCERLEPHWVAIAMIINQLKLASEAAGLLLNQAGFYIHARGRYRETTPLYERALAILEHVLGAQHPSVATSLNNLAMLHHAQGDYAKAAPLLERALAIREQVLGAQHADVATGLNNLGLLHYHQGEYAKAAPLLERALAISEQVLGSQHPDVAHSLGNLASLHHAQGDYAEAAPLFERALEISEQVLGSQHPDVATGLNNLAMLHKAQGEFVKAAPLHERALAIREHVLGAQHPNVAESLNNLAGLHHAQGDFAKAAPLLERALAIREQVLGAQHPDVAMSLSNLAMLHHAQGENSKAAPLLERALAIREHVLGAQHPDTVAVSRNYGSALRELGRDDEAAALEGKRRGR